MSINTSNEFSTSSKLSETNSPTIEAQRAVHQLLGLPGSSIESPDKAANFLRLDTFWSETVPLGLSVPTDREIFLGFDFDESSGQIVCTETTLGDADSVEPKRHHLVMLHTEVAHSTEDLSVKIDPIPSKVVVFADNLPEPHTADMRPMLSDPSVYAEIIIRLGLKNDPAATLVALRTIGFKNIYSLMQLHELEESELDRKNPVSQSLKEDRLVTQEAGIALYRGFTLLPPRHDDILRLRKFKA